MTNFTYNNRALIFFIIIGFLAAVAVSWQRHAVENANSSAEIIMTYDDIANMAHSEGVSPDSLFRRYKEAGVTSLSISETTLENLQKEGKLAVTAGTVILEQIKSGGPANFFWQKFAGITGIINAKDVYITTEDKQVFDEVKSDLARRLSPERVKVLSENGRMVLAVKADYEKVIEWNLGLSVSQLQEAVAYGFYVVPRPTNYTAVTTSDIEALFERLAAIDQEKISAVVFAGTEALGYPNLLPETAARFKKNGYTLGLIEHPVQLQFFNQAGLLPLAAAIDYKTVRLYTIHKAEQLKLDPGEASRRFANSSRERNIRLNFLRPFEKTDPGKTLIQTNLDYVAAVKTALLAKGFKLAKAEPFQPYFAPRLLLALIALGISCGIALLLANIFPMKNRWQYLTALLIAVILIFPILKGAGNLTRQLAALASVCCFPVLAVIYQTDYWQRLVKTENLPFIKLLALGVTGLTLTTAASLAGGIYAGAILSDIRYFLEIEIFRGVKLSFVAPLILISLVYLTRFDGQTGVTFPQKINRLLNYPVLVKTILLAGAAAVAIYVFLGRSGHTAGLPVPGIEVKMRVFLEEVLYARPRAKEFLIGHPAFLLFLGALRFNLPKIGQYILLVAATIGQSSVAQTFAHMRTPVFMSVMRGLDGLALGLVTGAAALIVLYVFMRFTALREKERNAA